MCEVLRVLHGRLASRGFFAQEVPHPLKSTQEELLERDRRIQNQTKTIQQTGGIEVLEQNIGHMIMLCGLQGCVCLYHCFYDG